MFFSTISPLALYEYYSEKHHRHFTCMVHTHTIFGGNNINNNIRVCMRIRIEMCSVCSFKHKTVTVSIQNLLCNKRQGVRVSESLCVLTVKNVINSQVAYTNVQNKIKKKKKNRTEQNKLCFHIFPFFFWFLFFWLL